METESRIQKSDRPRNEPARAEDIARLVVELANQGLADPQFYGLLANLIAENLRGQAAVIWGVTEDRDVAIIGRSPFTETVLPLKGRQFDIHRALIGTSLKDGVGSVHPPGSRLAAPHNLEIGNTSLLTLMPTGLDGRELVLELFVSADTRPDIVAAQLRALQRVSQIVVQRQVLQTEQKHKSAIERERAVQEFAASVHRSLIPREVAATIVSDMPPAVHADRGTVALKIGNKIQVEAVSGQLDVNPRSRQMERLRKLIRTVLRTGQPLIFLDAESYVPEALRDDLEDYVDEADARQIVILPMAADQLDPQAEAEAADSPALPPEEILGCVVLENFRRGATPLDLPLARVMVPHAASAMTQALSHHRLFLMPVWQVLGRGAWILRTKTLPKTLAITAAIVTLLVLFFVIPAEWKLESPGELIPVERRHVFADIGGRVEKVVAFHGKDVNEDDPLVFLQSTDLNLQISEKQGQHAAMRQRQAGLQRQLLDPENLSPEERARIAGEEGELEKDIAGLNDQLRELNERKKDLTIRSPATGRVITWNVRENLEGRQLQVGQQLMTIANTSGKWEVELAMPAKRMGHIRWAQSQLPAGENLKVSMITAADPTKTITGTLVGAEEIANLDPDAGSVVHMKVQLDDPTGLPDPRAGTEVTAKVHCGQQSLAWIWTHDILEFLDRHVFF